MNILNETQTLIDELNATNSKNDKVAILKQYPQCQSVLKYVYDPLMKFNVTSANLKKRNLLKTAFSKAPAFDDIFSLLDALNARTITGHDAIDSVNKFIAQNDEYKELICNIIDKNLKVRIDKKSINKAFPGLIAEFSVALAYPYDKFEGKVNKHTGELYCDFDKQTWFLSRKLDGCRAICIVRNGKSSFWSREGNQFLTLSNVEVEIENIARRLKLDNFVLDGEMCIEKPNGTEDFKSIVSQIKRKDYTVDFPRYKLFDAVSLRAFEAGQSKAILSQRQQWLQQWKNQSGMIDVLDQIKIESTSQLTDAMSEATRRGWEGLIIRKDVGYEGKRSADMLKLKKFLDAEYEVKAVHIGDFRVINKETGLEETIKTVANVIIEHKGSLVSVGSGFSLEERKHYMENPDELKGAIICVQYFEETTDKDGNIRLRFPTVKHVYGKEGRGV